MTVNSLLHRIWPTMVLSLLLACGEEISSEDHIKNAGNFLQAKNYPAAIVELKTSLQKDKRNTRARAMLGQVYFESGGYEDAAKELSNALSMGVDPGVVVPTLAQVLLGLGEYQRLDELKLDGLDPESRSIVQAAKGLSMMYRDNLIVAEEIIDAALENQPSSAYAMVASARLAMQLSDLDSAHSRLQDVIERYPAYAPAWNLMGDIESAERRPKKAEEAYTKVIELTGNNFDALLNRSMMRIYQRNYVGASQDLAALFGTFHEAHSHPGAHFASGLMALQSKELDHAESSFKRALEFSDAYPQTFYYLATISLERGLVEQALSDVYRFLGLVPGSVVGSKLAAKLELGQGSYEKAEQLLLPVVAVRPFDIEAMNLLASAYLAQGKSGEGVELLARVAELQPGSSEAKARLGAGFLAAGRDELGIETLREILEQDPGYEQADILIVLKLLQQGRVDEAILAAQDYKQRNPTSATSYDLLGRAYLAAERRNDAIEAFQQAMAIRPGDPGAGISLAEFALQEENYALARSYYQKVLAYNPDHIQTRMKLAASFALEGKEREMLSVLQSTIEAYPRAMEPRLMKARYYIARGELERALPIFDELSEEQKEHPDTLVTLAGFELAAGRHNQAVVTIKKLTELYPDVSQYHYMLAKAYAGLGDIEQFTQELVKTVELDPSHFYAKIATARLAYLSNQLDAFEKQLSELRSFAPDNGDVLKLEAALAQKKGNNKEALLILESLFQREPIAENAIALASQRRSMGDLQGAIEQLQKWLENHKADVAVREKLAEIYGSNNQIGGVIYQYRRILDVESENVIALNNLAWHLRVENPKEALEYALKAQRLSPDSSLIVDTVAMVQLKNGNLVEARRNIDRAISLAPRNPEIRYHEAQIRAAEGDVDGAIRSLRETLEAVPTFSSREAAESFLKQLEST